jgi:hypothetical protein
MDCRKSPNPPFQWTCKKPRATELIRYLFDLGCTAPLIVPRSVTLIGTAPDDASPLGGLDPKA